MRLIWKPSPEPDDPIFSEGIRMTGVPLWPRLQSKAEPAEGESPEPPGEEDEER